MPKPLLPSGCYDLLPPYAHQDMALQMTLLGTFEAFGYVQVAPPLLEFTDSLLAGRGAALSSQVFRVMDPNAHKVMGLRADLTMQIARIAGTRLAAAPRPLRLCYAGSILRMQPKAPRNTRQLRQAGIELIGAASAEADAEVIRVSVDALRRAEIGAFTIDLNLPILASALCIEEATDPERAAEIYSAIAYKDADGLRKMKLSHGPQLAALVEIAAPAQEALEAIARLKLPKELRELANQLTQVIKLLAPLERDGIVISVDPADARGLEYHTGITFSFLTADKELGRGGRYRLETGEEATGATLYIDALRGLLPPYQSPKRVLVAGDAEVPEVASLQDAGFITLIALSEFGASPEEATRLGCTHYYKSGELKAV